MGRIHTTRASGIRSLNEDFFGCSVSFLCFLSSRHDDSILFFCSIFRWMLVWSLWRKVKKILRIGGGRKIFLFYFILFPLSSKNILENLIFFFGHFHRRSNKENNFLWTRKMQGVQEDALENVWNVRGDALENDWKVEIWNGNDNQTHCTYLTRQMHPRQMTY